MGETADRTPAHEPPSPGRDAPGRFTKGNRGGPGNPFARQVAALRKTFIGAVSHEQLKIICERLVAQAMLGDVPSTKLLLGYVLGKIPEPVNPDTLDQQECRQYLDDPTYGETEELYARRPPADLSAVLMRSFHMVQMEDARQSFRQQPEAKTGEPEPSPGEPGPLGPGGVVDSDPPGADAPGSPELRPRPVEEPSASGPNGRATPSANGRNGAPSPDRAAAPPAARSRSAPSANGDNG